MDVTPQNVHKLAEKKDEENLRFRMFLKAKDMSVEDLDKLVFQTTDVVWAQIDCTTCGNCCKEVGPVLNQQDVERVATRLGMTAEAFIQTYLKPEEDPDEAGPRWEMRALPCPLLKDNRCTVYEDRPDACRRYPYLHEPDFVFRTLGMLERASTCPIVFEVLERLKDRTDFHAADEDGFGDDEDYELAGESQWPELLETGPTPWDAIRALAGRLPQDHELLESVHVRLRELVDCGIYEAFSYEAVHLPAVLALTASNLSDEQRRRTAYALVETLNMAGDVEDGLYMEILCCALAAFGDAAVPAALEAISRHSVDDFGWFHLWDILLQTTPQTEASIRQEVIRISMDALRQAGGDGLNPLWAMAAGEALARLKAPEAEGILDGLAAESVAFKEIAAMWHGKQFDLPEYSVEQWVESQRDSLREYYDSDEDERDEEELTEHDWAINQAVDPDSLADAPTLPIVNDGPKIGRNDPCPCGSGKKYKKCCGR